MGQNMAEEQNIKDLAYDFLYHDARRIQSFLAQFNELGHSQQVRRAHSESESWSDKRIRSGDIGIASVIKGHSAKESADSKEDKESIEGVYDPFWANAKQFVNLVEREGLIKEIWQANIGSIVKCDGMLIFLDIAMIQKVLSVKTLRDALLKEELQNILKERLVLAHIEEYKNKSADQVRDEYTHKFNVNAELLTLVTDAIHCQLLSAGYNIWTPLEEQNLVPSASTLVLKHGIHINGNWTMIGILDAVPGRLEINQELFENIKKISGPIASLAVALSQTIRNGFGKPEGSFSMTPLLIMRSIGN